MSSVIDIRDGVRRSAADDQLLTAELADMRELQAISTRLIQADGKGLYDAILESAQKLLRSDMGTIQLFDSARDGLTLLSSRGFDPNDIALFDWVERGAGTSCAIALRAGARVSIPDVEVCELVAGTPAHPALRRCGIRAALSTPLVSRTGTVIGMITNHWREPHEPSEKSLLLIDVLARQAADLIDRNRNEERIIVLAREAEHRAKNLLAAVQAVVRLTKAETAHEMKEAIAGRVNALDNVHRLFVLTNWSGADLRTLIEAELAPYCGREDLKAELQGPPLLLEPNVAQAVSMTLHELATNAAKYGSFSVPGGRVGVQWTRTDEGALAVRWIERGGPTVIPPSRQGVGTRVMEGVIRGQSRGTIQFAWQTEGLSCEFSVPIA